MIKKIATGLLVLALMVVFSVAYAAPSVGDLIRFVPTQIIVSNNEVDVDGYFVNLNKQCDVMDFTNFDMTVYLDGSVLVDGRFGTINSFIVRAQSVYPQSFSFSGTHNLRNGVYACDDHFYASFGASFTSRS